MGEQFIILKTHEEVQLEAVRQNWHAIEYIKNPSEEVQLIAALSKDYD